MSQRLHRGLRASAMLLALQGACVAMAAPSAVAVNPPGEFDCLFEPSQTAEIRSPVTGLIERVHVERGSTVKRGTPLVTLEASVERAATEVSRFKSSMNGVLQSTESRLVHATRKLHRRADLATENFISAQDRDDTEAEQRIAQADALAARENKQLAQLELVYTSSQLALRQIRSPFDGVVIEQTMFPGELAEIGENRPSIMKLAQINPLRVKVILPLQVYAKVKAGQRAEVVPEKPIAGRFGATIAAVDKVIDAASGTFQARIDLPNPNGALPSGVKCKVTLVGL